MKVLTCTFLEGLRKTMRNPSQYSQCPGQSWDQTPPEHKSVFCLDQRVWCSNCELLEKPESVNWLLYTIRVCRMVVEALCYKPEGRGFKIQWGQRIISIYLILPALDVYSAFNRNDTTIRKIMFLGSRARPVRKDDKLYRHLWAII
jgi:hypothetical protein